LQLVGGGQIFQLGKKWRAQCGLAHCFAAGKKPAYQPWQW
jgi:hypothetical protein